MPPMYPARAMINIILRYLVSTGKVTVEIFGRGAAPAALVNEFEHSPAASAPAVAVLNQLDKIGFVLPTPPLITYAVFLLAACEGGRPVHRCSRR